MNNNKYKILLVEDEANIRSMIAAMLDSAGYQSIQADSCTQGFMMYASHLPDLIILDLGLPDEDGMVLLKKVRRESLAPIIILSARSSEQDKVAALDAGANDYVTKPFGSAELLARVRSALRHSRMNRSIASASDRTFILQDLSIDYDARRVFIRNEEIHLTQTEYNIVAFLSEHSGKMMTYSAIIKAIWGYPDEGSVKKLQVNMANIRRKFGARPGEFSYISNEIGVGYRMNNDKA